MKQIKKLFIVFLVLAFLAGIYVILTPNNIIEEITEQDTNKDNNKDCPNLLVQKGNLLMLYNTNKPTDDNNPIPFSNLDEYIYYLEIQRKNGNKCPILYLQQENNTQGQDVYRIRPSPFDKQGGLQSINNINEQQEHKQKNVLKVLDASQDHLPYNKNQYNSFDPYGQYVGYYTNVDVIHDSTKKQEISDNPMDPNWGGTEITQQSIDTGKYDDNNIFKPMLYQPKMAFLPIQNKGFEQPKDIY
jgi:hypothetical protein